VQVGHRRIDGGEVLLHNRVAALAVGLLDGLLDLRDGLVGGKHAADGERSRSA